MNLKEITTRSTHSHFSEEEMKFVVENYIKDKKGASIKINLRKGLNAFPRVIRELMVAQQLNKLFEAFNVACNYYQIKYTRI